MQRRKSQTLKRFLVFNLLGSVCFSGIAFANQKADLKKSPNRTDTTYLESGNKLKDYILDTGDILNISFINAPAISKQVLVDEEGEIYLPRIRKAYVRGLTIKELTKLLEDRYTEFLISPEIYIRIITFKPIRVSISGEVRSPGIYKFEPYQSFSEITEESILEPSSNAKRENEFITTLSNAIFKAGGLTSYSDISQIEVTRHVPIGNGGGKKRSIIDLTPLITKSDPNADIRLYDGDIIYISRLEKPDKTILPRSILNGLSPKFISVTISGKIENPGSVSIPVEGSLSDVMNLTGPRKPLSGNIFLIRYNNDGTLLRKNIRYSSSSLPGSINNPILKAGDLITVKNSILGRTAETLDAVTKPFVGIYTTKELIESFND